MFEFLSGIDAVLGSTVLSGIVGGVFGWLNRREDRKTRAADQAHELKMIQATANANQQTSEARAFEESQKTKSSIGGMIKSAVRPVITGILYYYIYKFIKILEEVSGGLKGIDPAQAVALYEMIIISIVNLASMATSWWFASRPSGATTIPAGTRLFKKSNQEAA